MLQAGIVVLCVGLLSVHTAAVPEDVSKFSEVFGLPDGVSDVGGLLEKGLPDGTTSFGIAPAFGNLTAASVKKLDDDLKIIIAETVRSIEGLKDKSWDQLVQAFRLNEFLVEEGVPVHRVRTLEKKRNAIFDFDGSPDSAIVENVKNWFENELIQDPDVVEATQIDLDKVSILVAKSGAAIDSFSSFFYKVHRKEHTALDVEVLRFPDLKNPFFKLYRIELVAWRKTERVLFYQEDKMGITGTYDCSTFIPSKAALGKLTRKERDDAIAETEKYFL